jgi:LDH2 family malate/lactate/ureidoglycolate dehydrogenase
MTPPEREAIELARELAHKIGHAAVVVRKGKHHAAQYRAGDSWQEVDHGWVVLCFVSSKGAVVFTEAHA